ncbi:disintegrin and metalloproteinase domain-containing protein 10-like protein [Leptotrombidium deliense]|uniref:ADAM10 endopeptidase n=1 Tax=Leptotrombidium deliense TaxID=299467 RepID=A0A443STA8_9ACAR|nr:disintegrin and metalloproteinase domain-containing protein 10-like protein [Leptotrombidium deliense]
MSARRQLLVQRVIRLLLIGAENKLSKFITNYEGLTYDAKLVHNRAKRSVHTESQTSDPLHIDFKAHGKDFNLRLTPDVHSVFSKNIRIEKADGERINVDLTGIYTGHLHEDPHTSKVYGSVYDGVFEGKIHTPNATYYVERAHKYFDKDKPRDVHSVIYSSDDVNFEHNEVGGGCGNDKIHEWMNSISNSAVDDVDDKSTTISRPRRSALSSNPSYPYSSDGNYDDNWTRNAQSRISHDRKEFNPVTNVVTTHFPSSTVKKRACSLYIQTDTYLWDHIRKDVSSDIKAREEIASLVAQHIKAVNHIYENSDFHGIRGLKFIVQRLKINDSSACDSVINRTTNPFCSPNIDVSNFLNLNSQFNHDDFCLAYIFTYRDFSGGTLGLAWVASTSGASGGICEKYKAYTENIHGRQVQTKRSLNTGIITFVNYNSRVPPKVSELTLAHEIGHNFGSPHDYPNECRPGGPHGNFIMYSSATSGERQNNNKFSPCSIKNISAVLHAVFNGEGKHNCFQEDEGPFCGNKIVEEGEECDCGYDAKECTEQCCYPREAEPHTKNIKGCTRRAGTQCSPSQGPCCSETCSFEHKHKLCRHESECTFESFCSGYQALCPLPPPKPNKTECNGGTQVCWQGLCVGSICQKYEREECFLTSKSGAKPDEMCEVACQITDNPSSCKRTSELDVMKNISGLKLRPGSPCNDFQGYCDVFQRCRAVDAEGPLARLKNLLFNQQTLMSIKAWVTKHWWACMLLGVALSLFMAAFIKCCAVHTPSSNPKKRPALRLTDTLKRPADTLRRKRHRPQQSRTQQSSGHHGSNIPLQQTSAAPTAPPQLTHQYSQPVQLQQTQLVVSLPPEFRVVQTDPPPPYPGHPGNLIPPPLPTSARPSTSSSGPTHGYGEGRGHYNRKGQITSNIAPKPAAQKPVNNGRKPR